MKIAVFSDLHLKESQQNLQRSFARLIRTLVDVEKISDLWLLGDIFDLMIGPFPFWLKVHAEIFDSLNYAKSKGVHILWCEGNHDFHIQDLLEPLGIDVIDGEQTYIVGTDTRKAFVAHGDLVNLDDKAYQAWRAITRNSKYRKALGLLPSVIAQRYFKPWAERLSAKSRGMSSSHSYNLRELYRDFANARFNEGFYAVFMGHCHVEDLYVTERGFYVNLGSALDGELRYALWDPDRERFPNVLKYSKL